MSFVEVTDYALWIEHIHGNQPLQAMIRDMQAGDLIELEVDGFRSMWEKLPTRGPDDQRHGIKASCEAHRLWHALRDERRGGIVSIKICA